MKHSDGVKTVVFDTFVAVGGQPRAKAGSRRLSVTDCSRPVDESGVSAYW